MSLQAPITSTNRTITLPDSTGTIATSESTLAQFNATGAAPVYACRAWVNFNGTGVVAIRASGNVSSIEDLGVGSFRLNFITALPDSNYSATSSATWESTSTSNNALSGPVNNGAYSTTQLGMFAINPTSQARIDPVTFSVAIFR